MNSGMLTRRAFIGTTALASAALGLSVRRARSSDALPKGPAPTPVPLPHFPSRLHAFVWRNWPLVPAKTLGKVIGRSSEQVRALAQAMGLGEQPKITTDRLQRTALTIIKRNWHLLPYEQLLELLGWSAEELACTLREDDFLYIKLGSLKPKGEPIRYTASGDASQVRRIVEKEFASPPGGEPLFAFLKDLSRPPRSKPRKTSGLRLCYSYF